jgi:hypothetical protein
VTHDLREAAERLADVLARENAALAALDLRGAAGMLAEKQQAAAAFAAAQPGAGNPPAELARRLRDLAQENREKLEYAINVQRRVIGIIARAIRSTTPTTRQGGTRYGATGAMMAGRSAPVTLSARA